MNSRVNKLIEEFESRLALYNDFRLSASNAITELLRLEGLEVHSVTSRTKTRDSFIEKIGRAEKDSYNSIDEITDIVGIRVITNIEDEVDKVGEIISREFSVDAANSVDKRQALDVDRFGYLSLHFVCQFNDARTSVPENRRFRELKFEIQVRSILQHAWAEIEHDLGYKAGSAIPQTIRRRFSRLAGLLEIADDEFRRLRDDLSAYESNVSTQIEIEPASVALDDVSLASFLKTNRAVHDLDEEMASYIGCAISDKKFTNLASALLETKISSIEELDRALNESRQIILTQWKSRMDGKDGPSSKMIRRGISLFHLWQVRAFEQGGGERLAEIFAQLMNNPSFDPDGSTVSAIRDAVTRS
ncbi:hypothetical protein IAE60_09580 [Pseudoxanthomonas mexicana]|uniref:RelA/SpoT domain-containing protein n=1 Tax=Pseudoxanthomonas mexicana TaxID=128785 RepID=A0A7G9T801_PSEMX|nr:hypothetical protein [Pseudoxanthomonas mexicana]QNN76226.1 hypothetical protein IAE60_09580 [Pseudoxanthomonas mexicana]